MYFLYLFTTFIKSYSDINKRYHLKVIFSIIFVTVSLIISISYMDLNDLTKLIIIDANWLLTLTNFSKNLSPICFLFSLFGVNLNPIAQQLIMLVIVGYIFLISLIILSYLSKYFILPLTIFCVYISKLVYSSFYFNKTELDVPYFLDTWILKVYRVLTPDERLFIINEHINLLKKGLPDGKFSFEKLDLDYLYKSLDSINDIVLLESKVSDYFNQNIIKIVLEPEKMALINKNIDIFINFYPKETYNLYFSKEEILSLLKGVNDPILIDQIINDYLQSHCFKKGIYDTLYDGTCYLIYDTSFIKVVTCTLFATILIGGGYYLYSQSSFNLLSLLNKSNIEVTKATDQLNAIGKEQVDLNKSTANILASFQDTTEIITQQQNLNVNTIGAINQVLTNHENEIRELKNLIIKLTKVLGNVFSNYDASDIPVTQLIFDLTQQTNQIENDISDIKETLNIAEAAVSTLHEDIREVERTFRIREN